jgi:hypothetical protein
MGFCLVAWKRKSSRGLVNRSYRPYGSPLGPCYGVSMLRLPFRIFNGGSSIIMAGYGAATVDLKLHS